MGLLGGAVAAEALLRPLAAPAQQGERVRRIGVLMHLAEPDREGQDRLDLSPTLRSRASEVVE
jgi:hypothetical protein